eukprot:10485727-Lingulodinium_polyedra.AAC.1
MARVVSKGIVTVCRHTGPRKARFGGHGIGADLDGFLSFAQVIYVCKEKNLIGRIPPRCKHVVKEWVIYCLWRVATD